MFATVFFTSVLCQDRLEKMHLGLPAWETMSHTVWFCLEKTVWDERKMKGATEGEI